MKRYLSIVLALIMVVSLMPLDAFSLSANAAGVTFDGGDGTEGNPYLVSTKTQLNAIRNNLTASYKLTANIAFDDDDFTSGGAFYNGGAKWTPIGDSSNKYKGTFDGNGHTISGLEINAETDVWSEEGTPFGLFGYCDSATIKNLGMINGRYYSNAGYALGGIVGCANNCQITNCYNQNELVGYSDFCTYGGIVGEAKSTTITYCYNTELIGVDKNDASIINNALTGEIGGKGDGEPLRAGGIIGASDDCNIYYCYNTGDVVSSYQTGGIVGVAYSGSEISNCYNIGYVEGLSSLSSAGGISGSLYIDSTITNCYNAGSISSYTDVGGICGSSSLSTITNCYYLNSSNVGIGYLDEGTDTCVSCTSSQLKNQTTFAGFDFDDVWEINELSEYPMPTLKGINYFDNENVLINEINFPDATFRSYVSSNIDTDSDGMISEEEIENVTRIDVSSDGVVSLKGLEYFVKLQYLYCYSNKLTTLDVSKNTNLKFLSCGINDLSTLDVSKNTALEYLYCDENDLTTLNTSNNLALEVLYCEGNKLTILDVSKNIALETFGCNNNQLTVLDVSKNIALKNLYCGYNELTTLDVRNNVALISLHCRDNKLTTLDISKNTALKEFDCSINQLTTLDVSKNIALETLSFDKNQLTTFDASNNVALKELHCSNNELTTLNLSNNDVLSLLICYNNKLTVLDVSKNISLKHLNCADNKLKTIDVSKNIALERLLCYGNELTILDLSKNIELIYLDCRNNQLSEIILYAKPSYFYIDDGFIKYNDSTVVVKDNSIDTSYTGLMKIGSYYCYINNGEPSTETGIIKMPSSSDYKPNAYVYIKDGKFMSSYKGLLKGTVDGKSAYYYVVNGVKSTTSGLVKMPSENSYYEGKYVYLTSGKLDTTKTGLYRNSSGTWLYVSKGVHNTSYKGLAKKPSDSTYWYVESGKIVTTKTGLYKMPSTSTSQASKTIYLKSGKFMNTYTGLVKDGAKYKYVSKGILSTKTGLYKMPSGSPQAGKYVYLKSGVFQSSYTGLVKVNSKYKYVVKGIFIAKTGSVKIPSTSTYYKGKTVKLKSGVKV